MIPSNSDVTPRREWALRGETQRDLARE